MRRVPAPLYWIVRRLVPIACIDVLPYDAESRSVFLITRRGAHGEGDGYALVGGGIHRGELVEEAVLRHLRETLAGDDLTWHVSDPSQPRYAAQFFPEPARGDGQDPRKHAIALTYVATRATGSLTGCMGEATGVESFPCDRLPPEDAFVYGHGAIAHALARGILAGERAPLGSPR